MIRDNLAKKYLRDERIFPHVWCAGCGIGQVLSGMLSCIDRMGWTKDEVVVASGIGCSSRLPVYIDFNTLHTTHGRSLAFATGVKLAKPELNVIAVMGDGDSSAIGGNHLIHASRRNVGITAVIMNNYNYGMTGGQVSPLTEHEGYTSTSPYGNAENPFNIAKLVSAAGASFVARTTIAHPDMFEDYFYRALNHEGFSLVEVLLPCYTSYGRRNKFKNPTQMVRDLYQHAKLKKHPERYGEMKNREFPIGIFADRDELEFSKRLAGLSERVREKGGR